jgi:pimeloyl-ACP methyl ester carboxylesterase
VQRTAIAQVLPALPVLTRDLARPDQPPVPRLVGSAPPVVLLHGFGTSSRVVAPLGRHLERHLGRPVVRLALGAGRIPLHLGDVRRTALRVQHEIERLALEARFPYVDVVGHSLGGVVAAYLLKALDRGRRVRRVVTLGAPHRGTPLALVGAMLFGAFSRAIWQMIPGSPLLRELERLPVPERSELVSLASDDDAVVPLAFARVRPAERQENTRVAGLGHLDFLFSRSVFRLVQGALG